MFHTHIEQQTKLQSCIFEVIHFSTAGEETEDSGLMMMMINHFFIYLRADLNTGDQHKVSINIIIIGTV
jgi:hypothetical protein